MRKKILSLAMIPLLIISVLSVLNTVDVSADPSAAIYFSPNEITSGAIGTILTWPITTDYAGDDIWGYEFSLTYNPLVLEVLNVTNGGVVANKTGIGITSARFINGSINNTLGKLSMTTAYFYYVTPPPNKTDVGTDVLATVNFNVTGDGDSDITFGPETKLIGYNATAVETYNIIDSLSPSGSIVDGYFRNMIPGHNVKIANVSANKTWAYSGQLVNVTVNATNTGNVTEKFDVTAYYSTSVIGTETITVPAGQSQNVSFIWDTTPARYNLTLSAEASTVGSTRFPEDTTDNTCIDGTILVRPPILSATNSTGASLIINTTHTGGDTFTVYINITDAYELSSAVFNLTWDPDILTATSNVSGGFFGGTTIFKAIASNYNDPLRANRTMRTTFINYSRTDGGTDSDNGTLAIFTFEVVTRGGSWLELTPANLWWTEHWKTTPVVVSGLYTNYYDMGWHTGSYRWVIVPTIAIDWAYPTWNASTRPVKITVNPKNNGFLHMSYNMSVYVDQVRIGTEILTLVGKQHSPLNRRLYTFDWDYTGKAWGEYIVTANITDADPLDNDSTNDDFVFGEPSTIRIPGDHDGNAKVEFADFIPFCGNYGDKTIDSGNVASDIDGDGDVDFSDFIVFCGKYGTSTNAYSP